MEQMRQAHSKYQNKDLVEKIANDLLNEQDDVNRREMDG